MTIRIVSALLVGSLLAAAGCGGPELRVRSHGEDDEAKVYFKPTHDGAGNETTGAAETMIGEVPTGWEVPESLRGGRGRARVVYSDGDSKDVSFSILKDADTVVTVTKPPKPRK